MNSTLPQSKRESDEQAEMLPVEPPPLIVSGTAWLLALMFVVALIAAIVVQVPETVRCQFVLAPRHGADPIQAPYHGVVSDVRVVEAQEVAAGAELFVLRSDEVRAKHTQLQTLTQDLRTQEDTIVKMEAAHIAQRRIKSEEIAQFERELEFREDTYRHESRLGGAARQTRADGRCLAPRIDTRAVGPR